MAVKKSALGRGLGALIEDANESNKSESNTSINEIDINLIEVNPFQPRKNFDEESLQELAVSIGKLGIVQPITVRKLDNNKFQLISGERRFRASLIAGLSSIPAYIRIANDQEMVEMALVENILRDDLNSIEIAISFQRLIEEFNLTQEELSERVGKKRATVANYLRLLKLPAEMQVAIKDRKMTMGHARAIISVESIEDQKNVFHQILDNDLTVREVEKIVSSFSNVKEYGSGIQNINSQEKVQPVNDIESDSGEKQPASGKKVNNEIFKEYTSYQNKLRNHFNVKVEVVHNNNGIGKIVIPFHSDDELSKIISILESNK